jgi:choline dehydrogenase-like flavoprotein
VSFRNPDVVVIGSGAGGGVSAWVLASAGLDVLLLEKGENVYVDLDRPGAVPSSHFSNDELKLVHRDFIDQDPRIEPRTYQRDPGGPVFTGKVNSLATTVGGGTTHYDGNSPRCQQKDFRARSLYGAIEGTNLDDWPISYADLEPFYDEVERLIGIQGEDGSNPFAEPRSSPFPMPPGYPKYVSVLLAEAARSLGYHPFPIPIAINSIAYRGRPACTNCGFCGSFGCAVNAKGNTAVTAIREALLTGNCELRPSCFVHRLNTNRAGTAIESVEYVGPDGKNVVQHGGAFILAGNAIESARLCLLSSDASHPDGLGNSSGLVGRNLLFHSVYTVFGVFPQRTHIHHGRVGTHGIDDFNRAPDPNDPDPLFGGGTIEFGAQLHPIAEAKNLRLLGEAHKQYMRDSLFRDHLGVITLIGEDLPLADNRVTLDPQVRDVYGFPVARITYREHPNDVRAAGLITPKLEEILRVAGAVTIATFPLTIESGGVPNSRHVLGTLRMGSDASRSVTDPFGKFHDLDNLYCADGGVFVTSTGCNPTLTIQALASRQAHEIAR